jgi:hypothetical protein
LPTAPSVEQHHDANSLEDAVEAVAIELDIPMEHFLSTGSFPQLDTGRNDLQNSWFLCESNHPAELQRLKKKEEESKSWKLRLMRMLYERGSERQEILELFRFIDRLLVLPWGLESVFLQELQQMEKE